MRLETLAIVNFRVIRRAHLNFADQVIGIIGPNGAGKSSIVEAIAWALYGHRVARSGKDEIRSTYAAGGEECGVELGFQLNREHYLLSRRLVGRQDRMEVTLSCNGRSESVGTTETEAYVANLLGLDWRGFLTSFLARQQELNALADLAPGLRRQHLAGMLGIDRLDQALRKVKDERRVLQQTIEALGQQQRDWELVNAKLVDLREHVRLVERQQDSLKGARSTASAELEKAALKHREHEQLKTKCSQLQAELETVVSTLEPVTNQLADLCSQEKRLQEAVSELAELKAQVAGLPEARAELTALEQASLRQAELGDIKQQVAGIERQKAEVEAILRERRAEAELTGRSLAAIPPDISKQLQRARERLERARTEWTEAKANQRANQVATTGLEEQLGSIERVGTEAVCERCRRPFGNDLDEIRRHLTSELEGLRKSATELATGLESLTAEGDRLRAEVERLESLTQTGREAKLRAETLQREIETIVANSRRLSDQQTELEHRIQRIGAVDFDPGRLAHVREATRRMEATASKVSELTGELGRLPEVQRSLGQAREREAQLNTRAGDLRQQLTDLNFDPTAAADAMSAFEACQEKFEQARQAELEGAKELEIARREIQAREEELTRLAEAGLRLEACRTDQFYTEKLANLFADFRKFTISRIRPRLAELSSQLITEMSDGRYSLVELDEDYNLQIMDSGQYFGVDRFSGGEKDLASLCLRLAISLALTESAGMERSFVILDEVFGSQDTSRRELIFKALANLKERFPQILLVTHLEELKNRVESLVELAPSPGGWSEVKVNGQTT